MNTIQSLRRAIRARTVITATVGALALLATAFPASAAPAPSSGDATSQVSAQATIPLETRVAAVEHTAYAPVRETVAEFLQKAATNGVVLPAADVARLNAAPASTGCWYWNDWRNGKNAFGATLWTFNVEPNWCGNGSWITNYAYTNTWGTTSWIGWEYKGVISSSDRWGMGWNVFESTRQGSFCYINFYGCVQNQYPYVDVEVGAGGQIYKS